MSTNDPLENVEGQPGLFTSEHVLCDWAGCIFNLDAAAGGARARTYAIDYAVVDEHGNHSEATCTIALRGTACGDGDGDGCDDCTNGNEPAPDDDGLDGDGDGLCDLGDPDDDNDGALDDSDTDDSNPQICSDLDGDGCEDCAGGAFDLAGDGPDFDGDGLCDAGDDDDDDDDGRPDTDDPADQNAAVCGDTDGDGCDDCAVGIFDPANDGSDTDGDGLCDVGDPDDDGDGVDDVTDTDPLNANVCGDTDGDLCDDCTNGGFDPADDGPDADSDGICDAGDSAPPQLPGMPGGFAGPDLSSEGLNQCYGWHNDGATSAPLHAAVTAACGDAVRVAFAGHGCDDTYVRHDPTLRDTFASYLTPGASFWRDFDIGSNYSWHKDDNWLLLVNFDRPWGDPGRLWQINVAGGSDTFHGHVLSQAGNQADNTSGCIPVRGGGRRAPHACRCQPQLPQLQPSPVF